MTDHEWLQIIALGTPVFILLVALAMIPLTRWQDERWARRCKAERKLKAER